MRHARNSSTNVRNPCCTLRITSNIWKQKCITLIRISNGRDDDKLTVIARLRIIVRGSWSDVNASKNFSKNIVTVLTVVLVVSESTSPPHEQLPVVFESTDDPSLNLTRTDLNCDRTGTCYDGQYIGKKKKNQRLWVNVYCVFYFVFILVKKFWLTIQIFLFRGLYVLYACCESNKLSSEYITYNYNRTNITRPKHYAYSVRFKKKNLSVTYLTDGIYSSIGI